ncbi:hypothetical protein KY290_024627 [Solanum tuberosum]|uniref:Uncharacterized protein n=1 Tax=Solanum tuberosum TaxID=4113 RepID=A0ABQ7UT79_SOLTU|nr:hypothetical protein KY284_023473 [Solanum tuberosum]KAH0754357.1 hypothetical protein KY290_024627 [Solanum tuberosum]
MEVLVEMEAAPVGMEARDLLLLGVTSSAAAATSSAVAKVGGCGRGWRRGAGRGWWRGAGRGWVGIGADGGGSGVGLEWGVKVDLGFES